MSTTDAAPQSTPTDRLSANQGAALKSQNQSIKTFAASLSTAAVIFGAQMLLFLILSGNWKFRRSKNGEVDAPTQRQSLWRKI